MADNGRTHGRHCYSIGCHCDVAKAANAKYSRDRRLAAKELREQLAASQPTKLRVVPWQVETPVSGPFTPVTVESDGPLTRTQTAVAAQIARIPDAQTDQPALVAVALRLAGQVDSAEVRDSIAAAKELRAVLTAMRPAVAPVVAARTAQDVLLERLSAAL